MGRSLTPIYTVAETRALEAKAMAAAPNVSLMQKAGAAAAAHAKTLLGDSGKRILILAGPGNNGGDALEVAVLLKQQFLQVSCVFTGDTARLPVDAALALGKWRAAGGELLAEIPSARKWDLVVDGLFGIGLTRAPTGRFAELIDQANAIDARKLALDMPSGINADTGEAPGTTFRATDTITFIALKPGLLTLDGPDHCGALTCAPLDLESERLIEPHGRLADEAVLDELPAPRPRNFHKGMAGTVAERSGLAGSVLVSVEGVEDVAVVVVIVSPSGASVVVLCSLPIGSPWLVARWPCSPEMMRPFMLRRRSSGRRSGRLRL